MKHRRRPSVTCRLEIAVLGAGGVGKTCLIRRLLKEEFLEKYIPTVQDAYETTVEVDEVCMNAQLIDTAGNYEFPAMRRVAIANADAIFLVYSTDKPNSLLEIQQLQKELPKCKNGKAVPIVVVANKTDLKDCCLEPSLDSTIELNDATYCHLNVSSKTELNVDKIWRLLKEQMFTKSRKTSATSALRKLTKGRSFFKSDAKETECN